MNPLWFLRAKRWAQNPPSAKRVIMVFAITAFCIALALLEHFGFWPDWATANRMHP